MAEKFVPDAELLRILEDSDESDYEYDSDIAFEEGCNMTDEEDLVERDNNSDTDTEESDEDHNNANTETQELDDGLIYVSKSGFSWKSNPPRQSRTRLANIINFKSGLTDSGRNFTSIKDVFFLFLTEEIVTRICSETNKQIDRDNNEHIRKKCISPISVVEINSFVGILLSSGRLNGRKIQFKQLWTTNELFRQYFYSAAMSRDRFSEIFSVLRFDDRLTRSERMNASGDKMEAFNFVFNKFVDACKQNYIPGTHITVDERLAVYRGNCKFRVYMKSKPGHYGIKIWAAADSESAYTLNLQVYTGMLNKKREVNQGERIVMDLLQPYFGSGRGVTTDSFFTSIPLAKKLLEKKITITGTLRSNKREIPPEFLRSKAREEYSSLFGFTENMTLVSYVPKKRRSVALLSTEFIDDKLAADDVKKKPEIILHYNHTKGSVDTTDKMRRQYSCVRPTKRWPFRLFMELIDISALNAYILWITKFPDWKKSDRSRRKLFIEELAIQLVSANVDIRKNQRNNFKKTERAAFDVFNKQKSFEIETDANEESPKTPISRKRPRCYFCPRNEDKKTRTQCSSCQKPICSSHRIEKIVCKECNN